MIYTRSVKNLFLGFLMLVSSVVCAQVQPIAECGASPPFVAAQGLNPQRTAFSTSEKRDMGLVCYELPATPNGPIVKKYVHPSWKSAGYLAPIAVTKRGGVYVGPAPNINTLANPPEKQNILYYVNPNTAEMTAMIDLPRARPASQENAFGVLGLVFDCERDGLFASSVAGSDIAHEVGRIYSLQTAVDGKLYIIDSLTNTDVIGVGIVRIGGQKRLFFGKARSSDVFSIQVSSEGRFVGEPQYELTLADLGLRGDDRARKIRFTSEGDMTIKGVEFYFNLIAPTEKKETNYTFSYNADTKKWVVVQIGQ